MIFRAFTRLTTIAALAASCLVAPTHAEAQRAPYAATAAATDTSATDTTAVADSIAGQRDGAALAAKGYGWFGRSFIVGGLTNVIGAVVMIPVSVFSSPSVPREERAKILSKTPEYQKAFERSHDRRAYRKRILTTIAGSLLGAVVNGIIINTGNPGN